MTTIRVWVALVLVAATAGLTASARRTAAAQANLGVLPYRIARWTGQDSAPLDPETARILAAQSYLMRRYTAASSAPVDLYIAYYAMQQPGVSIHSPLHCLPGTGWEAEEVAALDVGRPDGTSGRVRRLLVRKNLAQAVVLYWYSIHGRMLEGEMASKLWLLNDSLRLGRSDAALVRIVVPVGGEGAGAVAAAERQGVAFARAVLPFLPSLWS